MLHRFDNKPTSIILLGRGVAQIGMLAFLLLPTLSLADGDFNRLTIGITVSVMVVYAPGAAFQQHLVRFATNRELWVRWTAVFALACAVVSAIVCCAIGGIHWWYVAVSAGTAIGLIPLLSSSRHALAGQYTLSAIVDAASGVTMFATAVALHIARVGPATWAVGYGVAWLLQMLISSWGPLRAPSAPGADPEAAAGVRTTLIANLWDARVMLGIGLMSMAFNRADYLTLTRVADPSQAATYALAGRVVGPILLVVGSLNNSLYVRQINTPDRSTLGDITRQASRRMAILSAALVPLIALAVLVLNVMSEGFASRHLLVPSTLLAAAAIPFAIAVPFSYALNSLHRERIWFAVLTIAVLTDVALVAIFGSGGANRTAVIWCGIQVGVGATMFIAARSAGLLGGRSQPHRATLDRAPS